VGEIRISPAKPTTKPFFDPWMGNGYRCARNALLAGQSSCRDGLWHVMGESHYGTRADDRPTMTQDVMGRLALAQNGYPFFDTLLMIVTGKARTDLDRPADWDGFAYSNFVQDVLPDDDRRPYKEHWRRASDAFFAQLAITRPKQLLVVGRTQWDNLPTSGYTPIETASPFGGDRIRDLGLYAYDVEGETAFTIATFIYHPSSRGKLNINDARQHVRTVTTVSCNIIDAIRRDDEGWYIS